MANQSVYIKLPNHIKVNKEIIDIGDIAKIYSTDKDIAELIKNIRIPEIDTMKNSIYIVTSLKIIELITKEIDNIEINMLGNDDVMISYYKDSRNITLNKILYVFKIIFTCILIFLGSAFAIMAFNNDISIDKLFANIYYSITGKVSDNHTPLELGYCIGIPIGILIFYNHFCNHKITKDPTPIEIEMQRYENDIADTLISGIERKDCKIDVD